MIPIFNQYACIILFSIDLDLVVFSSKEISSDIYRKEFKQHTHTHRFNFVLLYILQKKISKMLQHITYCILFDSHHARRIYPKSLGLTSLVSAFGVVVFCSKFLWNQFGRGFSISIMRLPSQNSSDCN